jgi:hypothetical protein
MGEFYLLRFIFYVIGLDDRKWEMLRGGKMLDLLSQKLLLLLHRKRLIITMRRSLSLQKEKQ